MANFCLFLVIVRGYAVVVFEAVPEPDGMLRFD